MDFCYTNLMSMIDEYLSQVAPAQKAELERVRRIVNEVAPEATEGISYGIPAFKFKGKYLIGFAAFKDHMSIFPGAMPIDLLKNKLGSYTISKGTIQFTLENSLPEALIKEILTICLANILDEAK